MISISNALPKWLKRPSRRRGPLPFGTRGPGSLYRKLKSLQLLATRDRLAVLAFLRAQYPVELPFLERLRIISRFIETTNAVRCYHSQVEILAVVDAIFQRAGRPDLTVLEAGVGKGASTAKLSLAAAKAGGRLMVFDSFRGLPANNEIHNRLDGSTVKFFQGAFTGRLPTVRRNVEKYGSINSCTFFKGWFEESLADFDTEVDVVILDVDLLSSTRTCIKKIFPKIRPGGVLFSQDGHLKAIVDLMKSESFWRDEVGVEPPLACGLGERKMVELRPRAGSDLRLRDQIGLHKNLGRGICR